MGGLSVTADTDKAIIKLTNIPTKPIPSGEMPKNQFAELFESSNKNLK